TLVHHPGGDDAQRRKPGLRQAFGSISGRSVVSVDRVAHDAIRAARRVNGRGCRLPRRDDAHAGFAAERSAALVEAVEAAVLRAATELQTVARTGVGRRDRGSDSDNGEPEGSRESEQAHDSLLAPGRTAGFFE